MWKSHSGVRCAKWCVWWLQIENRCHRTICSVCRKYNQSVSPKWISLARSRHTNTFFIQQIQRRSQRFFTLENALQRRITSINKPACVCVHECKSAYHHIHTLTPKCIESAPYLARRTTRKNQSKSHFSSSRAARPRRATLSLLLFFFNKPAALFFIWYVALSDCLRFCVRQNTAAQ